MKDYIPDEYLPLAEWLNRQATSLHGDSFDNIDSHHQLEIMVALCDLLANVADNHSPAPALCITPRGDLESIPNRCWRAADRIRRLRMCLRTGRIFYTGGWGHENKGRLVIHGSLPSTSAPDAGQEKRAAAVALPTRKPISEAKLGEWLESRAARMSDGKPPSQDALEAEARAAFPQHHVPQATFRRVIKKTPLYVADRGPRRRS